MKHVSADGRTVNIPDVYIQTNMKNLGLTSAECVEMYLSDEGIKVAPEVLELTAKAKAAGTGAKATGERKERKAPVRKPDEVKRSIIAALASFLDQPEYGTSNVEVTNIERMIAFELGGDKYEVTLTKKRPAKK
jgi:hypothetical protein